MQSDSCVEHYGTATPLQKTTNNRFHRRSRATRLEVAAFPCDRGEPPRSPYQGSCVLPTLLNLPVPKFNGYEISATVSLPFLPGVRTFAIHGELEHGNVASEKQLDLYRSLTEADFPNSEELDDHAYKYFQEVAQMIDVSECGCEDVNSKNIHKHYEIQLALVPPLWGSEDRYLVLGGNCDWDDEHGIQMVVRNASVIKCSPSSYWLVVVSPIQI